MTIQFDIAIVEPDNMGNRYRFEKLAKLSAIGQVMVAFPFAPFNRKVSDRVARNPIWMTTNVTCRSDPFPTMLRVLRPVGGDS
jgi:hypothetical protein